MPEGTKWQTYEQVAADLLNRFAKEFGLDRFEGKQHIDGEQRYRMGNRCEGNSRLRQWLHDCRMPPLHDIETVTGEIGRTRVSDHRYRGDWRNLREPARIPGGRKRVAAAENIFEATLSQDSTPTDFVMGFLNKFMLGVSTTFFIKSEVQVEFVKGSPDKGHAS